MTALQLVVENTEVDHFAVADGYNSNENGQSPPQLLPEWVEERLPTWGDELEVLEWRGKDDDHGVHYRLKHGWKGKDFIHDKDAPVRIMNYYVQYGGGIKSTVCNHTDDSITTDPQMPSRILCQRGGVGTTLTGIAHFTTRAESHKGFCHGGSMTSLLDDVIGWVAFLVTGECKPWTGFTVQVNSSLKRPIAVNSIMMVQATITRVERRKVFVEASIGDPGSEIDNVHASGTGLVILNRGVLPET